MGWIALTGMSFVQLMNLQPTDESSLEFSGFIFFAIMLLAVCANILLQRKRIRRIPDIAWEHVYDKRARLAAAAAIVAIPPLSLILILLLQIPNSRPIVLRAGAQSRDENQWTKMIPYHRLDTIDLGSGAQPTIQHVGVLFVPDKREFSASHEIHWITINNRSNTSAPQLEFRIDLGGIGLGADRSPVLWAAAVATNPLHPWMPFGDALGHSHSFCVFLEERGFVQWGQIFGCRQTEPAWLAYAGTCGSLDDAWCFKNLQAVPTREYWSAPTMILPPIPARGSQEIYLEFVFHKCCTTDTPAKIHAELTLATEPVTRGKSLWSAKWGHDL